jgi:hypothetical protein
MEEGMMGGMPDGIGAKRAPYARAIMEVFEDGDVHSGEELRRALLRVNLDRWEGSKVVGRFVSSGHLVIVDDDEGVGGSKTWRRMYKKAKEWSGVIRDQSELPPAKVRSMLYTLVRLGRPVRFKAMTPEDWDAWHWLRRRGFAVTYLSVTPEGKQWLEEEGWRRDHSTGSA